jgi:hypothetical protein
VQMSSRLRTGVLVALVALIVPAVSSTGTASASIGGWNLWRCKTEIADHGKVWGVDSRRRDVIGHGTCVKVIETWLRETRNAALLFGGNRAWYNANYPNLTPNTTFTDSTAKAVRAYKALYWINPSSVAMWRERIGRDGTVNGATLEVMNVLCQQFATLTRYQSRACSWD